MATEKDLEDLVKNGFVHDGKEVRSCRMQMEGGVLVELEFVKKTITYSASAWDDVIGGESLFANLEHAFSIHPSAVKVSIVIEFETEEADDLPPCEMELPDGTRTPRW